MRECTRRCKNRTKSVAGGILLQVWAWDSEELRGAREDDEGVYCGDVVNIQEVSPSRIRITRRISLGITTRPKSSILLTIPVAFMIYKILL